jgi:hypothetical protein
MDEAIWIFHNAASPAKTRGGYGHSDGSALRKAAPFGTSDKALYRTWLFVIRPVN